MPTLEEAIAQIEAASEILARVTRDVGILRGELAQKRIELRGLTADRNRLQALPESERVRAWCADYTLNLEQGDEVGTIEIARKRIAGSGNVNIKPAINGASYDRETDGIMTTPLEMVEKPFNWLYNTAVLPGLQKWVPMFRYGRISAIDYGNDTCTVVLDDPGSQTFPVENRSPQRTTLPINFPTTPLTNVVIVYGNCNANAFEIDDRVIVKFINNDWSSPTVIGFHSRPRPCPVLSAFQVIAASDEFPLIDTAERISGGRRLEYDRDTTTWANVNDSSFQPYQIDWTDERYLVTWNGPQSRYEFRNHTIRGLSGYDFVNKIFTSPATFGSLPVGEHFIAPYSHIIAGGPTSYLGYDTCMSFLYDDEGYAQVAGGEPFVITDAIGGSVQHNQGVGKRPLGGAVTYDEIGNPWFIYVVGESPNDLYGTFVVNVELHCRPISTNPLTLGTDALLASFLFENRVDSTGTTGAYEYRPARTTTDRSFFTYNYHPWFFNPSGTRATSICYTRRNDRNFGFYVFEASVNIRSASQTGTITQGADVGRLESRCNREWTSGSHTDSSGPGGNPAGPFFYTTGHTTSVRHSGTMQICRDYRGGSIATLEATASGSYSGNISTSLTIETEEDELDGWTGITQSGSASGTIEHIDFRYRYGGANILLASTDVQQGGTLTRNESGLPRRTFGASYSVGTLNISGDDVTYTKIYFEYADLRHGVFIWRELSGTYNGVDAHTATEIINLWNNGTVTVLANRSVSIQANRFKSLAICGLTNNDGGSNIQLPRSQSWESWQYIPSHNHNRPTHMTPVNPGVDSHWEGDDFFFAPQQKAGGMAVMNTGSEILVCATVGQDWGITSSETWVNYISNDNLDTLTSNPGTTNLRYSYSKLIRV